MLASLDTLIIGQSVSIPVEFVDSNDIPIPIFGSKYSFNLKDSPRVPDAQAVLTVQITFPDDQASKVGKGFLVINSNAWALVKTKQYYWSAFRVITTDTPQTVLPDGFGKVNVVTALNGTF